MYKKSTSSHSIYVLLWLLLTNELFAKECTHGGILENMILEGGISSNKYTIIKGINSVELCIEKCCSIKECDLAMFKRNVCYSVSCDKEDSCQISHSKNNTTENAKIVFMTRPKEETPTGQHTKTQLLQYQKQGKRLESSQSVESEEDELDETLAESGNDINYLSSGSGIVVENDALENEKNTENINSETDDSEGSSKDLENEEIESEFSDSDFESGDNLLSENVNTGIKKTSKAQSNAINQINNFDFKSNNTKQKQETKNFLSHSLENNTKLKNTFYKIKPDSTSYKYKLPNSSYSFPLKNTSKNEVMQKLSSSKNISSRAKGSFNVNYIPQYNLSNNTPFKKIGDNDTVFFNSSLPANVSKHKSILINAQAARINQKIENLTNNYSTESREINFNNSIKNIKLNNTKDIKTYTNITDKTDPKSIYNNETFYQKHSTKNKTSYSNKIKPVENSPITLYDAKTNLYNASMKFHNASVTFYNVPIKPSNAPTALYSNHTMRRRVDLLNSKNEPISNLNKVSPNAGAFSPTQDSFVTETSTEFDNEQDNSTYPVEDGTDVVITPDGILSSKLDGNHTKHLNKNNKINNEFNVSNFIVTTNNIQINADITNISSNLNSDLSSKNIMSSSSKLSIVKEMTGESENSGDFDSFDSGDSGHEEKSLKNKYGVFSGSGDSSSNDEKYNLLSKNIEDALDESTTIKELNVNSHITRGRINTSTTKKPTKDLFFMEIEDELSSGNGSNFTDQSQDQQSSGDSNRDNREKKNVLNISGSKPFSVPEHDIWFDNINETADTLSNETADFLLLNETLAKNQSTKMNIKVNAKLNSNDFTKKQNNSFKIWSEPLGGSLNITNNRLHETISPTPQTKQFSQPIPNMGISLLQENTKHYISSYKNMSTDKNTFEQIKTPNNQSEFLGVHNETNDVQNEIMGTQSKTNDVQNKTMGIQSETTDVQNKTLGVQSETNDVQNETMSTQSETTDVENKTLGIQSKITDVQDKSLGIQSETNDIKNETMSNQSETTDIQNKTLGIQSETTDVQNKILGVQSETNDVQNETLGIQSETTDVQNKILGVQSETNDIQNKTMSNQSETTDVQNKTLGIQSETTDVQNKTLGIQSETTDVQNKTMGVQSETTDVQNETMGLQNDTNDFQDKFTRLKSENIDISANRLYGSGHNRKDENIYQTFLAAPISFDPKVEFLKVYTPSKKSFLPFIKDNSYLNHNEYSNEKQYNDEQMYKKENMETKEKINNIYAPINRDLVQNKDDILKVEPQQVKSFMHEFETEGNKYDAVIGPKGENIDFDPKVHYFSDDESRVSKTSDKKQDQIVEPIDISSSFLHENSNRGFTKNAVGKENQVVNTRLINTGIPANTVLGKMLMANLSDDENFSNAYSDQAPVQAAPLQPVRFRMPSENKIFSRTNTNKLDKLNSEILDQTSVQQDQIFDSEALTDLKDSNEPDNSNYMYSVKTSKVKENLFERKTLEDSEISKNKFNKLKRKNGNNKKKEQEIHENITWKTSDGTKIFPIKTKKNENPHNKIMPQSKDMLTRMLPYKSVQSKQISNSTLFTNINIPRNNKTTEESFSEINFNAKKGRKEYKKENNKSGKNHKIEETGFTDQKEKDEENVIQSMNKDINEKQFKILNEKLPHASSHSENMAHNTHIHPTESNEETIKTSMLFQINKEKGSFKEKHLNIRNSNKLNSELIKILNHHKQSTSKKHDKQTTSNNSYVFRHNRYTFHHHKSIQSKNYNARKENIYIKHNVNKNLEGVRNNAQKNNANKVRPGFKNFDKSQSSKKLRKNYSKSIKTVSLKKNAFTQLQKLISQAKIVRYKNAGNMLNKKLHSNEKMRLNFGKEGLHPTSRHFGNQKRYQKIKEVREKVLNTYSSNGGTCKRGLTIHGGTLRGGVLSGEFKSMGVVDTQKSCVQKCCKSDRCDVAMTIGRECINIRCFNRKLCNIAPAGNVGVYRDVLPVVTFVNRPSHISRRSVIPHPLLFSEQDPYSVSEIIQQLDESEFSEVRKIIDQLDQY